MKIGTRKLENPNGTLNPKLGNRNENLNQEIRKLK